MKTFLLFAALALPCAAQTVPDAPRGQLDRADYLYLSADAAIRTLDLVGTRRDLGSGCGCTHEIFLPSAIADHTGRLAGLEAAMVAVDWFTARQLIRHRHYRLARVAMAADALQLAPWAMRNLTFNLKHSSHQWTPTESLESIQNGRN